MTHCCCNVPPPHHHHHHIQEHPLAACVLFTLLSLLSRSTGEYPTSELAFDRACMMWEEGGGAVCWESPISSGGRAFWSVGPHSTLSPAPSFCLCLPVFPHRSSPPARLTDRQMLSAVHLQLWASITLHKQPIACTQATNSVCLSPFR